MTLKPTDWSVVTAARWNRAILTPAGIRERVFGLGDGTVEVLVPIDLLAPPQVRLEGITVVANWDRLIVQPNPGHCSFSELDRARRLSTNALESLPETPLNAVGVNVVYSSDGPVEQLREALRSDLDERFFDSNYSFNGRTISRIVPWKDGAINLSIEENADQDIYTVKFNFERKSVERAHHLEWLEIPILEVQDQVTQILVTCLQIPEETIDDITTDTDIHG